MDDSSTDETSVLIPASGVPLAVRDNRRPYERQLAVYLILASTLFERLAFYSLAINLVVTLTSTELNWDSSTSTTATFIFFGKFFGHFINIIC
jgi:bacteriorhodopsin